ncbi:hypothetical protein [Spiroplasma chrysopicola]|uniref:Uncharacterized protein n=1 Tax=Spiroplasma chrysopicola DF-1 TaxID=1276227 RepID=R4UFQ5_9MOLU|nr:hypothetical protein [Spiroplasma chrysopicola]AGM24995.1 hypothetical protein SCHRY_v1c04130 [Spiroplasma chrysopicola DF-1]
MESNNLLIEKNYRGELLVSLLAVKKLVSYALRDIANRFFIDEIKSCLFDDNFLLHIFISGRVISEENLTALTQEINEVVINEINYALKLKPKNISITFHH